LSGFSDDEILRQIEEAAAEENNDASPQLEGIEYRIVVNCVSEEHQRNLLERFEREGWPCRALIS
jgi:hypothetical protein